MDIEAVLDVALTFYDHGKQRAVIAAVGFP